MPKATKTGRQKGAYRQTSRVLLLLDRLEQSREPLSVAALAGELGVTERQLRRDFAALEEAGHELVHGLLEGRAGVRLESPRRATVALSVGERVALVAAREVFRAFEGTDLARDVEHAVGKIADTLAPRTKRAHALEQLAARIAYVPDGGVKPLDDPDGNVDTLLSALLHGHAVDATYVGASNRPRTGVLAPYGIAIYRHALYLVGRWEREQAPRVHAVERFRSVERRRDRVVELPPDFDVRRFFSGAFGVWASEEAQDVVVDFAPRVAGVLTTRRYHASQSTTPLPGGAVRVRFRLGVTPDLVTWLVGWGGAAFVREPIALREQVRAAHLEACDEPSWV